MAGDQHGDIVGAVGRAGGAHRGGPADRGGDLGVGAGLAGRDPRAARATPPPGRRCRGRRAADRAASPARSPPRRCAATRSAISAPPWAIAALGKRRLSALSSSSNESRQMPLSVAATSIVPRSVSARRPADRLAAPAVAPGRRGHAEPPLGVGVEARRARIAGVVDRVGDPPVLGQRRLRPPRPAGCGNKPPASLRWRA